MSRPKSDAREKLLSAAIDHMAENGLGDLSLRTLATALGTSHRMLIYHFGSKEKLLVEVVRALERQSQEMVGSWISADEGHIPPAKELRRIWRFVTDPARAPYAYERLFYELYGQALQGRPHTEGFLEGNIDAWIEHVSRIFRGAGMSPATARDEARLAVATFRGLLLDFLSSGDRASTTRAFERSILGVEARLAANAAKNGQGRTKRPAARRRAS
jgi:AcrR family transcriptional regulator